MGNETHSVQKIFYLEMAYMNQNLCIKKELNVRLQREISF